MGIIDKTRQTTSRLALLVHHFFLSETENTEAIENLSNLLIPSCTNHYLNHSGKYDTWYDSYRMR